MKNNNIIYFLVNNSTIFFGVVIKVRDSIDVIKGTRFCFLLCDVKKIIFV